MAGSKLLSAVWAKAEAKAAAELDEGDAVAAAAAALGIADAPAEGDGEEEAAAEEVDVEKVAEVEERRLLRTLAALRELWVVLYTGVSDGSVKLTELANLAPLLLDSTERQLLVASARGLQAVGGGGGGGDGSAVEEWPMLSGELDAATVANLFRFGHVLAVKGALPSIAEALRLLQRWVAADARESVNKVAVAVGRLGALVNAQWATATFADAGAFAAEADIVDERLVSVDPSLILTLQDADSLLGWLRLTPNDNDFTSSIELALGRSEMECPDELWSREQRSVDESILSKLSGVRAFLHDHLYAGGDAELYPNLSAALEVVGRWDWAAAPTIAKSVRECSDVRLALQELLAGDSDSAAPGRLMQLAKLRARWRCSSEPPPESSTIGAAATDAAAVAAAAAAEAAEAAEGGGGGDGEAHLWLEYMLVRGGVEHRVVQQMTEVVEFQSAVVLSGQTRHGDVGARVDSFVVQFGLVQLLRETLAELKAAGHFGYATFSVEYSLDVAPDEIQAAVRAARASLAWWASAVARARDTHYHLNFYTLRQLAPLRAFLECSDGDGNAIMAELVRLVNPDMGDEQLRGIALDLTRAWDESGGDGAPDVAATDATAADVAAARDLGRLGAALDRALAPLRPRRRTVAAAAAAEPLASGVQLMCAEGGATAVELLLSMYLRRGVLPEREECLLCWKATAAEELDNLVRRWQRASEHGREDRLYAIGAVDALSFERQHDLVVALQAAIDAQRREGAPPPPPLVLVSGTAEASHVVAAFGHRRRPEVPLAAEDLRLLTAPLGFTVTSRVAGGGKSFSVRAAAKAEGRAYVHVPVHTAARRPLMRALRAALSRPADRWLVHLDLAALAAEADKLLAELLALRVLLDPHEKAALFVGADVAFAVELPSGRRLPLRVPSLLPQRRAELSAPTFCATLASLQPGLPADAAAERHAALQLACRALHALDADGGRFPQSLDALTALAPDELDGARCFALLERALRDDRGDDGAAEEAAAADVGEAQRQRTLRAAAEAERPPLSLWSLWGFVSVLAWQLRELHRDSSAINASLVADPEAEMGHDERVKAAMKGELVSFLVATAREFATRRARRAATTTRRSPSAAAGARSTTARRFTMVSGGSSATFRTRGGRATRSRRAASTCTTARSRSGG